MWVWPSASNTKSDPLANFVGYVVGFLNVCIIRLVASSLPPRYPLDATWYNYTRLFKNPYLDNNCLNTYIIIGFKITFCGEFMPIYFNTAQVPMAKKAFNDAEKLVSYHFRLSEDQFKKNKYDVKTLAYLDQQEIQDCVFAHLCKYSYEKPSDLKPDGKDGFDFYRICLQDNIILDAVDRANPFIKFSPLMLYIAVHELIHVLRFGNGEIDFNASREEKEKEEDIVHNLTRNALQSVKEHDLEIVLDCFSSHF